MNKETLEKFKEVAVMMTIAIIQIPVSGFVLMKLWNWIAVPVGHAIPISTVGAVGIMFIVGFFRRRKEKELTLEQHLKNFGESLFRYAICFVSGWVLSGFIA